MPIALLALLIAALPQTALSIHVEWTESGAYSHGYLAVAISAFLVHRNRDLLLAAERRGQVVGLIATFGAGILWLLGDLAQVLLVQQFAFITILNSLFLAIYGWRSYRNALLFPVSTLFLVVPIWNFLSVPLQRLSTSAAHEIVSTFGVPVLREGYYLSVPGGRFLVEESCSGLGFVLASTLLGIYFGYMNNLRTRSTVWFTAIALIIAILANWARIVIIILIGNELGMDNFIVQDHLMFGWLLFSAVLFPMIYLGHRFVDEHAETVPFAVRSTAMEHKLLFPALALFSIPILSILVAKNLEDAEYDLMPPEVAGYQSTYSPEPLWQIEFQGPDSVHYAVYRRDQEEYHVATVNYRTQEQGKELIYYANSAFDPGLIQIGRGTGEGFTYVLVKDRAERRNVITYWYRVGGVQTNNKYMAKALDVFAQLSGRPGASAIVVSARVASNHSDVNEEIRTFVSRLQESLAQ